MRLSRRLLLTGLAILLCAAPAGAQAGGTTPSDAAGRWTLAVTSPHGSVDMTLDLKVDGKKVSGTLSSQHTGERAVAGEVEDGRLKLETTTGGSDEQFAVNGTIKADAITGYVSTAMGDLTFTGHRVKG